MITYTIEKLGDNIPELDKLSKLHYKESCPYEDIPLEVNWQRMLKAEELGFSKSYIMRSDGKLIGYASISTFYPTEYMNSLQASMSNIFIHPDHRGNGGKFIIWCDEDLKKQGVQVVHHHVKVKNDYGLLLKRLGYDMMNIEYSKRLDK